MQKRFHILIPLLLLVSQLSFSQPCREGFLYRVPVQITNSSVNPESGLVEVKFDAVSLILDNKIQPTCADLRFVDVDGFDLPHWLDEANPKTDNQSAWVQLSDIPAGNTTIYMLYGNFSALSRSDATIFGTDFYDFSETDLDETVWSTCNGEANISDGQLILGNNTIITSVDAYTRPYSIEAYVSLVDGSSSVATIGQFNSSLDGYSLSLDKTPDISYYLHTLENVASCPAPAGSNGQAFVDPSYIGEWRFSWRGDQLYATGPGTFEDEMSVAVAPISGTTNIVLSLNGTGSMQIDWLRIRDMSESVFTSTLGAEDIIGFSPTLELNSNAPVCFNTNLALVASYVEGATYTWTLNGNLLKEAYEDYTYNVTTATLVDTGNYLVRINMGTSECNSKSAETFVQVDNFLATGTITPDTTVCSESNSGTIELAGYSTNIERWQMREGSGMWEDRLITDNVLPYSGLTSTHTFRAVVSSGTCGSGYSDETTVFVDQASNAGTLNENAVVCEGNSDIITLSGSTGDIQWETSQDNTNWSVITGISGPSYNYLNLNSSTYYRTQVTNGVCPPAESNTILITVNDSTEAGTVENGKIVCAGRTEKDTLFLTGRTGEIRQWEYAPTAEGPWTPQIVTDSFFIYQGLQFDAFYRVQVESPGCPRKYSVIDTVVVEQKPQGGTLLGSTELCANANQGYVELTSYTGRVVEWQYSYDGSSWGRHFSNYDTLNYHNLDDTITYRALVNSEHEVCNTVYSTLAKILVSAPTVAGSLGPDTTIACVGSDIGSLNLINYTGKINRWESSPTGSSPWSTINSNSSSLPLPSLLASSYYRAAVQSGVCDEIITDTSYVQIDQKSQGGIISGSTEVCEAVNEGKLNLFSHYGTIVKWESYINGPNWVTVPNSSVTELDYSNLTDTVQYRAILKSGVCPNDTSTIAKITVNPLPDMAFTADDVNLSDPTKFVNGSTIPGGLIQTWQWDFGDEESSAAKNPSHYYTKEGIYKVKLSATSNKGCLDSISHEVEIFGLPDVSFTFENVCLYSTMFFTNTSNGIAGTTYIWNFGDGTSIQPGKDATHKYTAHGTFTVTLKAFSSSGGVDSISKTVQVFPRAVPEFETENICENGIAHFTNFTTSPTPYLSYFWDFGNGETDQRTDPDVSYTADGSYPVKLRVTTSDNCSDSISKNILVFPNPVSAFSVEDVPYQQPSVFINESSISYGNLSYEWNFGDENTSDTTHPIYYYEAPGVYQVRLTTQSDSGCMHSIEKAVKIFDLPVVKFTAEDVCSGDSMLFINESTIPSGSLSFEWDFDDGNESEAVSPHHTYARPGIYNVRLISISNNGARDTVWNDVQVFDLPVVDYTYNEACYGYPTQFENLSSVSDGSITSVLWDYNDGTNSIQMNPEREFLNPGIYGVKLEVVSSSGCSNSLLRNVIVHHNPVADFSVEPVCLMHTSEFVNASFIDNSDRPYTLVYNWNFEDGQVSDDFEPNHRYRNPGGYQTQLVVSSDAGCRDTLYRLTQVYPLPLANAGKDTIVEMGFPITLQASGGTFYEWAPPEGLSDALIPDPEARPLETTSYTLRVTDDNSCTNFDTLLVTVEDVNRIIPSNILTPNNNGENDTWKIVNIDAYPHAEISIFDRWGKMIFETTDYNNDWRGVNDNGDILPDGTYYYVIILSRELNVVYKGAITILRDK